MGENKIPYTVLVGKPEQKRPLVRRTYRGEDNIQIIKMNLKGTGVIWLRVGNCWVLADTVIHIRVP
jgi:hypothetical protein